MQWCVLVNLLTHIIDDRQNDLWCAGVEQGAHGGFIELTSIRRAPLQDAGPTVTQATTPSSGSNRFSVPSARPRHRDMPCCGKHRKRTRHGRKLGAKLFDLGQRSKGGTVHLMVGIAIAVLYPVAWGALLTAALVIAETLLGWPSSIRMFIGGIAVFLGSVLSSGGSSRTLYEKGAIRRIDESDIREYKSTRSANISTGIRILISGAVVFSSVFVLP